MANKVFNMEGGLHSAAAYSAFEDSMYGSSVASASDLAVTAGTGMNVIVSTGNGLISTGSGYARRIGTTSTNTVTISAASSANPRIDSIVGYIDNSITPETSVVDNTNGILNFAAVSGTPAATPTAPTASAIQTAIGAGNPYIILANVTVPTSATAASSFTITDVRTIANEALDDSVATSAIQDDAVTTDKIADGAITSDKIDYATLPQLVYVGKAGRQTSAAVSNNIYAMTSLETPIYAATGCSAALSSGRITFTLPASGTYFVEAHFESWINANSWDYLLFSIRKNTAAFTSKMAYKGGAWGFVTNSGISTIENGDILDVYVNTNGNNFADGNISTQNTFVLFKIWRIG